MNGGPGPQPMEEDMIGAIKIKDAFFIGDEYAAQVHYFFPITLSMKNS